MYIVLHKQLECPTRCEDAEFSWSSLHDVYDSDYPFLVWLLPKRYSCLFNPCLFNPCLIFLYTSVSLFVFWFLICLFFIPCLNFNTCLSFESLSVFAIPVGLFLSFTACFHPCLSFLNTPRQFFSTVCNLNLVCLLNPCLTLLKFLGKTAHFLLLTFSSNDLYIRVLFILIIWTHAFFWWSVGVTTNQLTYTVVAGLIISWINGYRVGLSACLLSSTLAFFNLLKSLKCYEDN